MEVAFLFDGCKARPIHCELVNFNPQVGNSVRLPTSKLVDINGNLAFSEDETGYWFTIDTVNTIFSDDMSFYVQVFLAPDR